ncbi:MAG TPA: NADH-quinone oxidoreductase subunit C [Thermoanaerobaculia bacterium]|nr:NADH-quinone oxidoreductase subunit C [Thermoanaerobaculia bacterium]
MSAVPEGPTARPGELADPLLGELLRELAPVASPPSPGQEAGAERGQVGALLAVYGGATAASAAAPACCGTPCRSELSLLVRREEIARACAVLKNRFRYTLLVDLCGADYPQRPRRFEVVYHLYSFRENRRLRLKVVAGESEPVPSLSGVFAGAAWLEREVYDMYGVRFAGHPRLARLLLWDGFAGHPLRKDFPLAGLASGAAATERGGGDNDAAALSVPAGEGPCARGGGVPFPPGGVGRGSRGCGGRSD